MEPGWQPVTDDTITMRRLQIENARLQVAGGEVERLRKRIAILRGTLTAIAYPSGAVGAKTMAREALEDDALAGLDK